jgi:malate synthase
VAAARRDARYREQVTRELFQRILREELTRVRSEVADARFAVGRFADASERFERLTHAPRFEEFLTIPAYDLLRSQQGVAAV